MSTSLMTQNADGEVCRATSFDVAEAVASDYIRLIDILARLRRSDIARAMEDLERGLGVNPARAKEVIRELHGGLQGLDGSGAALGGSGAA